ncbi:NADH-ubiquinone oxidoreductase-related-like protein [Hibiscus syriacus]|uniref:NADH-ubiquinone oxidoreductase-related-like protein n=1 Tax=Hibiscus syriacus TaxID=106335 RepID=A0A6A2YVK0_HIBSY|nr:NADH-ubiquinone oxidoreductase-related-like protein [Hibiscus syriacus]
MIKTLNTYYNTAKTAEIMSRYRPTAPKPEVPANAVDESSAISQVIRQSPYLRNLWPRLQSRPSRTRKRGRTALSLPTFKRAKTHVPGLSSPAKNLSLHCFSHGTQLSGFDNISLVTLPLPPCPPIVEDEVIDLNSVAEIPEEKDLLKQLQGAPFSSSVIAPQPIRLVGSTIIIGCIIENPTSPMHVPKKPEEAEELPAVVSDSSNKVRLANSAYNERIGQVNQNAHGSIL